MNLMNSDSNLWPMYLELIVCHVMFCRHAHESAGHVLLRSIWIRSEQLNYSTVDVLPRPTIHPRTVRTPSNCRSHDWPEWDSHWSSPDRGRPCRRLRRTSSKDLPVELSPIGHRSGEAYRHGARTARERIERGHLPHAWRQARGTGAQLFQHIRIQHMCWFSISGCLAQSCAKRAKTGDIRLARFSVLNQHIFFLCVTSFR